MKATTPAVFLPDVVPVLSSGKHRNPRKGACFMEMASYLAGERWSDHPSCTHPLLASLARLVNDSLPDADRPRIVGLIPDVVGITGTDLELDVAIAARAGAAALPIAPLIRQNALAVGLLTCRRLASELPTDRGADLVALCDAALEATPDAHAWALRFGKDGQVSERTFRRQTAPHLVAYAVEGIAVACVDDVPARLVALLSATIHDTARRADRPVAGAPIAGKATAPRVAAPRGFERVRSLVR
ncbi:hypothetical protein GCM10009867_21370 [Pedococcus aerophilus]|uniref:Uncharacterized protein n=1 Tax=Pedococcus aerophilus TaxID=436356 RepID=A0ABN3UNZ1_9MICO